MVGVLVVGVITVALTELLVGWDLEGVMVIVFSLVTWDEVMIELCLVFVLMAVLFIFVELIIVLWFATGLVAVLWFFAALEDFCWTIMKLDDELLCEVEMLSFEEAPNMEDGVTRYLDEETCGEGNWLDEIFDTICVKPCVLLTVTAKKGETGKKSWINQGSRH